MKTRNITRRAWLGTAVAALAAGLAVSTPAPAAAQPKAYTSGAYRPSTRRLAGAALAGHHVQAHVVPVVLRAPRRCRHSVRA